MAIIGRRNILPVSRISGPGLYLNGGDLGEILLPSRYVPPRTMPGDKLNVFLYLDSEDRLVATTETPRAMVGEFAYLKVLSVNPRIGAFLDWGLPKDLLLPFREQETPVRQGQSVVVYVYLDERTGRIVATTRLHRHLNRDDMMSYRENQPVNLLVTGRTPLGYNVIVENAHRGLLYDDSLGTPVQVGQKVKGFIRALRPGGKLDVALDQTGYQRVAPLQEQIVRSLERHGGRLMFDDDSSPEAIRAAFGCSKKAFKQALGALYKSRRIEFTNPGIQLLDNTSFVPGKNRTCHEH